MNIQIIKKEVKFRKIDMYKINKFLAIFKFNTSTRPYRDKLFFDTGKLKNSF